MKAQMEGDGNGYNGFVTRHSASPILHFITCPRNSAVPNSAGNSAGIYGPAGWKMAYGAVDPPPGRNRKTIDILICAQLDPRDRGQIGFGMIDRRGRGGQKCGKKKSRVHSVMKAQMPGDGNGYNSFAMRHRTQLILHFITRPRNPTRKCPQATPYIVLPTLNCPRCRRKTI